MSSQSHLDLPDPVLDVPAGDGDREHVAVFAGGCFWCVDAVFRRLKGVVDVSSGYAGGTAGTANYRSVCNGNTDHAEVVRIQFDSHEISFGQLLKVFFAVAHDPTQLNRQGADIGRQYRSAVFPIDEQQRSVTESYIKQLEAAQVFDLPIVTTIEMLDTFYPAENYHQDYAALNPDQPYVACTVPPKIAKLQSTFADRVKPNSDSERSAR